MPLDDLGGNKSGGSTISELNLDIWVSERPFKMALPAYRSLLRSARIAFEGI